MKDLSWIKTLDFAHRGLHDNTHPENTMSAFMNAVKNGYHIEFDIQMTKDQQLVVIHDKNLYRLCNANINIQKSMYNDIKDLPILDSNQHPELLTTVLDNLPQSTHLLIELKTSYNNKKFVTLFLETMKYYSHTYAVHSFDPIIIRQFFKQDSSVIRGLISKNYKKHFYLFFLTHLQFNWFVKPDFINYHYEDLPTKKLDKLYKSGMCIISYTAKSQEALDFVRQRYDNAVFEQFIPNKRHND